MKKINFSIVTLLVIALTLVFASCTKDGVYKPKKKISKIYETVQTDPSPAKILKEEWTWDGKLLSKIAYHDGGVANFTYDKKQLSSITNGDDRVDLTYDGNFIENIKVYHKGDLEMTYTFEHAKKLISGYTVEYNGAILHSDAEKCARLVENVFRFILPEVSTDAATEYMKVATSNLKGGSKYTVSMVYDGKNVSSKTIKYGDGTMEYTYTYTDYRNPYYGLLLDMDESTSKNAVATCVRTAPNSPDYNYTYTYKADGKVPTQVTENVTWTLSLGSTTTTHTETIVTDYEFVK